MQDVMKEKRAVTESFRESGNPTAKGKYLFHLDPGHDAEIGINWGTIENGITDITGETTNG